MPNYNIMTLIHTEWDGMGWRIYQPRLNYLVAAKTEITEAYGNTGLFLAHTTGPYGLVPWRLYFRTQANGRPSEWAVLAIFQKEKTLQSPAELLNLLSSSGMS